MMTQLEPQHHTCIPDPVTPDGPVHCKLCATLVLDADGMIAGYLQQGRTTWRVVVSPDDLCGELPDTWQPPCRLRRVCVQRLRPIPEQAEVMDEFGSAKTWLTTSATLWEITAEPEDVPMIVRSLVAAVAQGRISGQLRTVFAPPDSSTPADPEAGHRLNPSH